MEISKPKNPHLIVPIKSTRRTRVISAPPPKNELLEIFRNKSNIKTIKQFLQGKTPEIKGIMIRGPVGCGKVKLISSILSSLDFDYQIYDTDCESDEIFKRLMISIKSRSFSSIFMQKQRAIIIRDIDTALRNSQKSRFYKYLADAEYSIPVFMTSHDTSVGTVREVPKNILQLDFELPFISDMVKLGFKIAQKENVTISKNALEKISKGANSDIRFLTNSIISLKYNTKKITIKNNAFEKDYKENTFHSLKYCGGSQTWEKKHYHATFYTNSTVFHNYPVMSETLDPKIYDIICFAEELRNFSYSNQVWDSFETIYCILGTVIPMSLIGDDFSINDLSYPPSTLGINNLMFDRYQKDSIVMTQRVFPSFFNQNNKFKGDLLEFQQSIEDVYDPVKSSKLGLLSKPKKQRESMLKELRKVLKKRLK